MVLRAHAPFLGETAESASPVVTGISSSIMVIRHPDVIRISD